MPCQHVSILCQGGYTDRGGSWQYTSPGSKTIVCTEERRILTVESLTTFKVKLKEGQEYVSSGKKLQEMD